MDLPDPSWLTRRLVVGLVVAVGVLSVATGVVNIDAATTGGPLGAYVPPSLQRAAGFTGALTGFVLLASGLAMRRGLRAAWGLSVVLLPVTALQGVVQSSAYSVPLVVLSLVALPLTVVQRGRFTRHLSLTTSQVAAGLAVVGVQVYGTVGTYTLREQYANVDSLLDAFYFTLVTASTVGYGDIAPASQEARLFNLSLVVLGTASFGIAIGALLAPAIEARFASALGKMTQSQLEELEGHVVVLGYGDLTEPILEELSGAARFVVVTPDRDRAEVLGERGYDTVVADPSDEGTLERVGVEKALAVVVATNDDAEDALAVLTARQLSPGARIVAAATQRENVNKLRRAGADTVISPAVLGGHLLVQSALGDEDAEAVADSVLGADGADG